MGLKDDLKEYYTVQELSALTKITESTIEKLAHGGEIACDIAESALRIPRAEAEKLLSKRRRAKWRRVALTGFGVLAAIAGAGVAWQKSKNREEETEQ